MTAKYFVVFVIDIFIKKQNSFYFTKERIYNEKQNEKQTTKKKNY